MIVNINKNINLKNSTFIKTILMLLVVFVHAGDFWTGTWFTRNPVFQSSGIKFLCTWIGSFHVYAFTLISGYIFAFKCITSEEYNEFSPFIKNKIKRLLVPYCFAMIIWVAPISEYFFRWDIYTLFKKYILCIDPSQLWFLWMLFDCFIIVWPFRNLILKKKSYIVIGISITIYILGILGRKLLPNIFCIWTAFQYLPFFIFGMRLRLYDETNKHTNKHTYIHTYIHTNSTYSLVVWPVLDLILLFVVIFISKMNGMFWRILYIFLNFLLNLSGAYMAWICLQFLAIRINWRKNKSLKISKYTFPIFLFHQQVIYFIIFWLNGKVNPWINMFLNFVISIGVSLIISIILMRFRITRFFIGEKY